MYPLGYTRFINTLIRTEEFARWLARLKAAKGKARIIARLESAALGHFGDCEPVGESVNEMRIHAGPGYRIYFTRQGQVVYILLIGGDKSTQRRDIKRAIQMARLLRNRS
jgi:putative addiction module killer protein